MQALQKTSEHGKPISNGRLATHNHLHSLYLFYDSSPTCCRSESGNNTCARPYQDKKTLLFISQDNCLRWLYRRSANHWPALCGLPAKCRPMNSCLTASWKLHVGYPTKIWLTYYCQHWVLNSHKHSYTSRGLSGGCFIHRPSCQALVFNIHRFKLMYHVSCYQTKFQWLLICTRWLACSPYAVADFKVLTSKSYNGKEKTNKLNYINK